VSTAYEKCGLVESDILIETTKISKLFGNIIKIVLVIVLFHKKILTNESAFVIIASLLLQIMENRV
jgi:hypothetical protein